MGKLVWTPEMKEIAKAKKKGLVKLEVQMRHTDSGGSFSTCGPMGENRCMALFLTSTLKDDDPRLVDILAILARKEVA
jgi:hypothetical protein